MINARYMNADQTQIMVRLKEGEKISNFFGPVEFVVGMSVGNNEYEEIALLIKSGELLVAEYEVPPPPPIVIAKVDLYRRMTEAEFATMQAGVDQQSLRIRGIFNAAVNFRSDAPEWDLLNLMADQLFGPERKAELLVPSE